MNWWLPQQRLALVGRPAPLYEWMRGEGMLDPVRDDILLQILALAAGREAPPGVSAFLLPKNVRPPEMLPPSRIVRWRDPAAQSAENP